MDLFYSILILIGIGVIVGLLVYLKAVYSDKETRLKLKRAHFVFRWWLIGKYHCKSSDKIIRLYSNLNRLFWGVVFIGICLVVGKLVEIIQWIF